MFGYLVTPSGGVCNQLVSVPAAIPNDPAFLGLTAAFQWGLSCLPGLLPASSQSNCLTVTVIQ
jgi:hypothetical protein